MMKIRVNIKFTAALSASPADPTGSWYARRSPKLGADLAASRNGPYKQEENLAAYDKTDTYNNKAEFKSKPG